MLQRMNRPQPSPALHFQAMTDELAQRRARGLEKRQKDFSAELERVRSLIVAVENGNARLRRSRLRVVGWD